METLKTFLFREIDIEDVLEAEQHVTLMNGLIGFWNKRSHGTKSAMLEGKLIIIAAVGH